MTSEQGNLQAQAMEDLRAVKARRVIIATDMANQIGVGTEWVTRRLRNQTPVSLQDLEKLCATLGIVPILSFETIETGEPVSNSNHKDRS